MPPSAQPQCAHQKEEIKSRTTASYFMFHSITYVVCRFQRPPGLLPSSMLGFEALTGALDDFGFGDYLNGIQFLLLFSSLIWVLIIYRMKMVCVPASNVFENNPMLRLLVLEYESCYSFIIIVSSSSS